VVVEGSAELQQRAATEMQHLVKVFTREVMVERGGLASLIVDPPVRTQAGSSAYSNAQGRGSGVARKKKTKAAPADNGGGSSQTVRMEDDILVEHGFVFVNAVVNHRFSHTQWQKKTAVVTAVQVWSPSPWVSICATNTCRIQS
jgi:hypothetical protein